MTPPEQTSTKRYKPEDAAYFKLADEVLDFTPAELEALRRNGFVISDRLTFKDFKEAYAYIYWKDLPVVVTTDSILHAIHITCDSMLTWVEGHLLTAELVSFLGGTLAEVQRMAQANQDARLAPLYRDLEVFLSVPLATLDPDKPLPDYSSPGVGEQVRRYLEWLWRFDTLRLKHPDLYGLKGNPSESRSVRERIKKTKPVPVGIEKVTLFGLERWVDFTLFEPRGRYEWLPAYFVAMSWLAHMDFRLATPDLDGNGQLFPEQFAAVRMLVDAVDAANQRGTWQQIDTVLRAFVGWSDNVTFEGLERFFADTHLDTPAACLEAEPADMLRQLLAEDYGRQAIAGQIQAVRADNPDTLPASVCFVVMGQRFVIEGLIQNELTFDRLKVNGEKVKRGIARPLDVMAALGNDRALVHLEEELARYGYGERLAELRAEVASYGPEFWEDTFYNRWLNAIRALNVQPQSSAITPAISGKAWADKMLHTQLASWAQLRFDHILYAKAPAGLVVVCEYPAGYVEPYPAFFEAVRTYARYGQDLFERLEVGHLPEPEQNRHAMFLTRFKHLDDVARRLQTLAQKEIDGECFTAEENLFVKSVVEQQDPGKPMCGGVYDDKWTGWYLGLLPYENDRSPAAIADIQTNLDDELGPVGVLHVGTGDPATMVMLVDGEDGQTLMVGPALTYYEYHTSGFPPRRIDKQTWSVIYRQAEELLVAERNYCAKELEHWLSIIESDSADLRQGGFEIVGFSKDTERDEAQTAELKRRLAEAERHFASISIQLAEAERQLTEFRANPVQALQWTMSFRVPADGRREWLKMPNQKGAFHLGGRKELN